MHNISNASFGGSKVVFDNVVTDIPGGVALNVTRLDYTRVGKEMIEAGTPVYVDHTARTAEVCKSALAIDGGSGTSPRISKYNHFKVGDFLNDGTTGALITAIDKDSSTAYDTFTVNTALVFAAGTKYQEGTVSGASTTLKYTPNGVVKSASRIKEGNAEVSVVTIGDMREASLTYPLTDAYKVALRGGTAGTGKSLITVN